MTKYTEDESVEATLKVLQEKYPYIIEILKHISDTPNGIVQLELRVYDGYVTDLTSTKVTRKTFKK